MVDTNNAKSKREFKKLSKSMDNKLDKGKGRTIESLEAPDFKCNASTALICQRAVERERSCEASHNDGQSKEREWHIKAMQRDSVVRGVPFLTFPKPPTRTHTLNPTCAHAPVHLHRSLPAPCEDLDPSLMVPFDEVDYEQRITSPATTLTILNRPTSHLLVRLIAHDDEAREINALLVVTSERFETESNRANTSECRALEYFSRLCQATGGQDRAEQESARLREELKLGQDIINRVSAQKSEVEAEAARVRTKARKLLEEKLVMIAYEEGRHRGYKERLSYGRRLGFDEARSRSIRYNES
ncbi:hypothetical protein AZE42_09697 [Rhizopogon vesiculosus]|uniref:Uncharacterized protein n=1 Tax=Rhizopogon vesiculosus TaxID=180088 RepID=A0A1J8Q5E3_9AGAM|nr:hypothetical protein AZE42_09697 [Rhizopogon vesiculosus]